MADRALSPAQRAKHAAMWRFLWRMDGEPKGATPTEADLIHLVDMLVDQRRWTAFLAHHPEYA